MKAKIIIENGETTIELKPENDFDTEIVEKIHDKKEKFNIHTTTTADYNYGSWQNHKIVMNITETK